MKSRITDKQFKRITRRELLKLTPVLALGAFAIPALQKPLLKAGLGFSDWVSAKTVSYRSPGPYFCRLGTHSVSLNSPLTATTSTTPAVDFDKWNLTVSGAVQKPGDYTLAQIQTLPKFNQNTRHVCVEGWDVIGNFGGVRLSDFLKMIGADTTARFVYVECADDYYESLDMADGSASADPVVLRNVRPAIDSRARRALATDDPNQSRL